MKWEKSNKAMTWKEGCVVVIHRLDRPQDHYGAYETTQWFRPDFVNNQGGYGIGSQIEYLKLAEPKKYENKKRIRK